MRTIRLAVVLTVAFTAAAAAAASAKTSRFGDDLAFLRKYVKVLVLSDKSGTAQVAVVPQYQGRVMTSTAGGPGGTSFGWLNRAHIASGKLVRHINVFGGEDRFWLGPEGGQYSLFFKKGVPFDLAHWFTPAPVDTKPFDVVSARKDRIRTHKRMRLASYAGTRLDIEVSREIRLTGTSKAWKALGVAPNPKVQMVAYETDNRITNRGRKAWEKKTGLPSIWILGMFNPSPATTVVIPFNEGDEAKLGPKVNDAYFGKVPAERLVVRDNVLFFSADGTCRSKIGLSPRRAKPLLGSYDAANHVLTLVQYTLPKGVTDYVNSMWEIQKKPFGGDAINSYNDGPPAPGKKPLGPFYELETSSPAAALKPGQSLTHLNRTLHLQGSEEALDPIARATLGVSLEEIRNAFKGAG